MKADVTVREVGLRDGLQTVHGVVSTENKKAWCRAEWSAGVPEIEICSFVPPRLLPQFVDADEVARHALGCPGLVVSALVPNLKGAQRALEVGVHKLNYVLSASESHNLANVRRPTQASVEDFRQVVQLVRALTAATRPRLAGGVATAFGCSIEGKVDEGRVLGVAAALVAAGADEIVLADTVGYAHPRQVGRLFRAIRGEVGPTPVAAHFHDTRGLGLANVLVALDAGVTAFDASLGGLGGCPHAPGATGNIATEDLVFMLEAMGVRTGIDLDRLLEARRFLATALPGEQLHGRIGKAGLPVGFRTAAA